MDNAKKCGRALNHSIAIVAYNPSENAWLAKNSWGASWGENGYLRI